MWYLEPEFIVPVVVALLALSGTVHTVIAQRGVRDAQARLETAQATKVQGEVYMQMIEQLKEDAQYLRNRLDAVEADNIHKSGQIREFRAQIMEMEVQLREQGIELARLQRIEVEYRRLKSRVGELEKELAAERSKRDG